MVKTRGYTLIELMVTLSLVGIGTGVLVMNLGPYQRSALKSVRTESLARVLDIEMERLRACDTRACLQAIATSTSASPASDTWARTELKRTLRPGPEGTVHVTIEAKAEDTSTNRLDALLWVRP